MNNFIILILDGVGVGELPDAFDYGDQGSNTLGNLADAVGGLELPALQEMGLGNITAIKGISPVEDPSASFGKMTEISKGKDSITGHWELGGLYINKDFDYFPQGFPDEIISRFLELTGCSGVLGNVAASGTEIIKKLGNEHMRTGFPIVYTSADSVFQIAAHEGVIPLKKLYEICQLTRKEVLKSPYNIGRVIARPFTGSRDNYKRTVNRKDYSLDPPGTTILDLCYENNITTCAVGKIVDLFNRRGMHIKLHTKTNDSGIEKIIKFNRELLSGLIFANLVDFDVYYGHRNDPQGFADALRNFDKRLPEIVEAMDDSDYLIITSDHGNDPTTPSTDHSREYVPLLFFNKRKRGTDLGIRKSFSDVAKTAAEFFELQDNFNSESFLKI